MVLENVAIFLASLLAINKAADVATDALSLISQRMGITKAALGIILVAVFSGMPELLVSTLASLQGKPEISWGNVVGSNMASIAIKLGIAASFGALSFRKRLAIRDGVFLFTVTLAATAFMLDGNIARAEGIVLMMMFIPYVINVWDEERGIADSERKESIKESMINLELLGGMGPKIRTRHIFAAFVIGMSIMFIGGYALVSSAIKIASDIGISEAVIGLTIVAIGTSVPDIAAAYSAAKKGLGNLLVGSIIGANIFTTLITLGVSAFISPINVDVETVVENTIGMCIITTLFVIAIVNNNKISRKAGFIILLSYVGVLVFQLFF